MRAAVQHGASGLRVDARAPPPARRGRSPRPACRNGTSRWPSAGPRGSRDSPRMPRARCPPGQHERVVVAAPGRAPVQRDPKASSASSAAYARAGRCVGAQHAADHRHEAAQPGDGAPRVEPPAGHHQVVGRAGLARRRGEATSWPASERTCQLTATSVGSKSQRRERHQHGRHRCGDTTDGAREARCTPRPGAVRPPGLVVVPMSDTGTEHRGPGPSPIFSPEDGLDKLWAQAYQGEVLGEASSDASPSSSKRDHEASTPPRCACSPPSNGGPRRPSRPPSSGPASPPSPTPRCSTRPTRWPTRRVSRGRR